MLFGYNVFIGLKPETTVADVFSLHRFTATATRSARPRRRRARPARRPGVRSATSPSCTATTRRPGCCSCAASTAAAGGLPDRRAGRRHPGAPLGGRRRRRASPTSTTAASATTSSRRRTTSSGPRPPATTTCSAATRTSPSWTRCSSRRSAATSPSRSRTTPRPARASTASRSTSRCSRSTTPTSHYARVGALILLRDPPVQGDRVALPGLQHPHQGRGPARRHRAGLPAAARGPRHHLPRRLLPGTGRQQDLRRRRRRAWSSSGSSARPTARTCSTSSTPGPRAARLLLPYNLIRKEVATPIPCHGYSLFDDGTLVVFRADLRRADPRPPDAGLADAVRLRHLRRRPARGTGPLDRDRQRRAGARHLRLPVGGPDGRRDGAVRPPVFEALIAACARVVDDYHWLGEPELGDLRDAARRACGPPPSRSSTSSRRSRRSPRRPPTRSTRPPREITALVRRARGEAPRSADAWVRRLAELRRPRATW